jgi:hypothetical protein
LLTKEERLPSLATEIAFRQPKNKLRQQNINATEQTRQIFRIICENSKFSFASTIFLFHVVRGDLSRLRFSHPPP